MNPRLSARSARSVPTGCSTSHPATESDGFRAPIGSLLRAEHPMATARRRVRCSSKRSASHSRSSIGVTLLRRDGSYQGDPRTHIDMTERSKVMRVFVAGASGAIGTRLVPQLIDRGHEVIGSSTSTRSGERVRALGAESIVLDLLDAAAVRNAVVETQPDAIVHQATALANARFGRNFDRAFAQTNRLRTEGTDNLLAAAREASVSRFVAQSFASMRYARD